MNNNGKYSLFHIMIQRKKIGVEEGDIGTRRVEPESLMAAGERGPDSWSHALPTLCTPLARKTLWATGAQHH